MVGHHYSKCLGASYRSLKALALAGRNIYLAEAKYMHEKFDSYRSKLPGELILSLKVSSWMGPIIPFALGTNSHA